MEVILALALGFLVGLGVGALRIHRLYRARRAALYASSGIARFLPAAVPTRSAADVLAGRIRLLLGGIIYDLPVLPRAASREWRERLDERFASLGGMLEAAGDDTGEILTLLMAQSDAMLDALIAYDVHGRLPERDLLDQHATDAEITRALLEVWRAANPLAATLIDAATESPTTSTSSGPLTGSLTSTDGHPASSSTA